MAEIFHDFLLGSLGCDFIETLLQLFVSQNRPNKPSGHTQNDATNNEVM